MMNNNNESNNDNDNDIVKLSNSDHIINNTNDTNNTNTTCLFVCSPLMLPLVLLALFQHIVTPTRTQPNSAVKL